MEKQTNVVGEIPELEKNIVPNPNNWVPVGSKITRAPTNHKESVRLSTSNFFEVLANFEEETKKYFDPNEREQKITPNNIGISSVEPVKEAINPVNQETRTLEVGKPASPIQSKHGIGSSKGGTIEVQRIRGCGISIS